MARNKLLSSLKAPFIKGRPPAEQVRNRIADAKAAAEEAERAWRVAALAVEAGGDPAAEKTAEAGLQRARQELTRLEAILLEVEAQDADEALNTRRAAEAKEDAEVAKAFDDVAAVAKEMAPVLAAYADKFRALAEASDRARTLAYHNPRVPRGLGTEGVAGLVSLELTRVSAEQTPPPGVDQWATVARDQRELTPLTDHFADLASAVRKGLNQ